TPALHGDGTYSFAILSTSTNDVVYQSREAAAGGPQLILDLRQQTDAQIAITAPASGSSMFFDIAAQLTATATDQEDGNLGTSLQWTSNIDGALGTGAALTRW